LARKKLSLDSFANGAFRERFLHELQRVSANIWNPNTSPVAKRTITLKLVITPDDRDVGNVEIISDSKLCPIKSVTTRMMFGYDEKSKEGMFAEIGDQLPGQLELEGAGEPDAEPEAQDMGNVQSISRWKKEGVN